MSGCFCAALAELSVLSADPREETRIRRTMFGIEIQRWRLASTTVIPDDGAAGACADARGIPGAIPRAVRVDDSTLEYATCAPSSAERAAHEP